jgi:hypothetical protein
MIKIALSDATRYKKGPSLLINSEPGADIDSQMGSR